jgi:hypothetical protein
MANTAKAAKNKRKRGLLISLYVGDGTWRAFAAWVTSAGYARSLVMRSLISNFMALPEGQRKDAVERGQKMSTP